MPARTRTSRPVDGAQPGGPASIRGTLLPAGLLIASGAAALIFQVLWVKQLSLIVGVDVYAVTLGVSAFFAGLALGGLAIGRLADGAERPLRLYATLEIGIAVSGVVTSWALARSAPLFARLEASSGVLAWALIFLLIAAAPFLMGGTLPTVVRSLSVGADRIGSGGGRMYAANTAGGIFGALMASFLLIPAVGIQGSALVAAGLGVLAATGALCIDRFTPGPAAIDRRPGPAIPRSALLAIVFYALAGGLALGYEVIWSQSIVQFMSTRSFAFSVMLATYLCGLALGAALYSRWVDRAHDAWTVFGFLIAAAGLVALLEISLLGGWLSTLQTAVERTTSSFTQSRLLGMCARFAIAALYLVLMPTLLLGAAFPAALRLVVDSGHVGRDIGRVCALNTLGGIAGTAVTGFVLVPRFGLVRSLAVLATFAASLGSLAILRGSTSPRTARWAASGIVTATVVAAMTTPPDRLAGLLREARGGELVFYEEGRGGTVAVLEQTAGSKTFRRLYIQGVSNSGDTLPSMRYMRLQALLPLIVHNGEPRSTLVIGLGTGITSGALSRFPGLEHRVVAELLPEVRNATSRFRGNYDVGTDAGVDIRLRDGRRELLSSEQSYDLITLEPPPPSAAGVVNLYSTDFYQLARTRLRPQGIVAQWLPLPTQNDEDTRSLVRSFIDVYPEASLWTTELHEMLLVGSMKPVVLDVRRIIERCRDPRIASALSEVGITSPQALLATWMTGRSGLESYASDAHPVTDDRPRIEYANWVRHDELQRTLPNLVALRTPPPLIGADEAFAASVALERQRLMLFYQAALNGSAGHRDLWEQGVKRVLSAEPENAYYRWFTQRATVEGSTGIGG